MRRHLALVAFVVILGACSSKTEDPPAAVGPAPPSVRECSDPPDDAGGTSADMSKVTLAQDGENLTVTYDLAADVAAPPDGASWLVMASTGEDDTFRQYQFGFKIVGSNVFPFIFEFARGKQVRLDTPYTATGRQVVARFPLKDLLPQPFNWRAVTTSSGNDVDTCPATGTLSFGG